MKKTNERMSGVVVSPRGTGELDHPYLEETEENEKKKKGYYPFAYDLLDITFDDENGSEDSGGMVDGGGDGGLEEVNESEIQKIENFLAKNYPTNKRIYIADVVEKLSQFPKQEVQKALFELMKQQKVNLLPLDDPREITQKDKESAIKIAGSPRHIFYTTKKIKASENKEDILKQMTDAYKEGEKLKQRAKELLEKAEQLYQQAKKMGFTEEEIAKAWENVELSEMSAMAGGAVAGSSGGAWTREDFIQERKIRKFIRERIKKVYKQKLVEKNIQEAKLRLYIQNLIKEATTEVEDAPHENTGINILADLLKKIIPTLETDYKTLTTDEAQRKSFRAHITNAVKMSLNRLEINKDAKNPEIDITEALDINVEDEDELELDNDEDKFIDIEDKPAPEDDAEEDVFTIPGEDVTGRNMALQSFDKIENQITDAYSVLSNEEDKKLFNDYLITNLKLYFDKFENELSNVEEPTTDEYEEETASNELEL